MDTLSGPRLGFIARVGRRTDLCAKLCTKQNSTTGSQHTESKSDSETDAQAKTNWVLVSTGGIPLDMPLASWPHCPGICWIFTGNIPTHQRQDIFTPKELGMRFIDVVASVDAIITKPGYGTFTEAALHCCPVLYLKRPDWPEQQPLIDWLTSRVPSESLNWQDFQQQSWLATLKKLLKAKRDFRQQPQRLREAAKTISDLSKLITTACQ
jgi:hypothetical protein